MINSPYEGCPKAISLRDETLSMFSEEDTVRDRVTGR